MNEFIETENERKKGQFLIDKSRTKLFRNQLGQFATPNELAIEILEETKYLLNSVSKINFLDPAIGSGSFFSAFLQVFEKDRIGESFGIDIDKDFSTLADNLWSNQGLKVINADFTKLNGIDAKADLLIANPPYVRHHYINEIDKKTLVDNAQSSLNIKVSALSGLYCHFLFHAHKFIKENGISVWLIPNEFLDVNYGVAVKQYLLNKVEVIRIHRFNPDIVKFSDALVSSTVLWFRNTKASLNNTIEFTFGDSITNPQKRANVMQNSLNPKEKWSSIFQCVDLKKKNSNNTCIKDLFTIRRGIATGNNNFFILNENKIDHMQLPKIFFKPILPSPKLIDNTIIESDKDGNPCLTERYFVLDCDLSFSEIENKYYFLADYIKNGEQAGISTGYICKNRNPWYSQEKRTAPLFICNYIGRENSTRAFRFLLNNSQAIITNSYLGMYPKPFFYKLMESDPGLPVKVLEILNTTPTIELMKKGRVYGGGMYKLEPKELENVEIKLPIGFQKYINPVKQLTLFEPGINYPTQITPHNRVSSSPALTDEEASHTKERKGLE